jgi:hypothetical protein
MEISSAIDVKLLNDVFPFLLPCWVCTYLKCGGLISRRWAGRLLVGITKFWFSRHFRLDIAPALAGARRWTLLVAVGARSLS